MAEIDNRDKEWFIYNGLRLPSVSSLFLYQQLLNKNDRTCYCSDINRHFRLFTVGTV